MRSSSFIPQGPCWNFTVWEHQGAASHFQVGIMWLNWWLMRSSYQSLGLEGTLLMFIAICAWPDIQQDKCDKALERGMAAALLGWPKHSLCWLDVYWWSSRRLVRHGQTASDLTYRLPNNNFYTCRVVVYQIRSPHGMFMRFWVGTRGPTTGTDTPLNHVLGQAFNTETDNLVWVKGNSLLAGASPSVCCTDLSWHQLNQPAPKMSRISQITRTFQLKFSACYNVARGKSKRIFLPAQTFHSNSFLFYKETDAI